MMEPTCKSGKTQLTRVGMGGWALTTATSTTDAWFATLVDGYTAYLHETGWTNDMPNATNPTKGRL